MSLCFVSNWDLTVPFSDIARRLENEGERIVWLVPSKRWARWLLAEGWPKDDVLCLPDHAAEWRDLPVEQSKGLLADIEDEAPATISNVIQMCRKLRRSPARFSYAYLAVARRHIEAFLQRRNVEFVFGEGTWGFELLTGLVCRRHGIPMVQPSSTRIPGDRFYFADPFTADLFSFAEPTSANREWARAFLRGWLERPSQPAYMHEHRFGYKPFHARWFRELVIGLFRPEFHRDDATMLPLYSRAADRIRRYVNAVTYGYLRPYQSAPSAERYVLYTLHHQPESSIDVHASLNSNQDALIETLSRLLPTTHKLWIKEHKGAIGDRSIGWYRRMQALPNVRLIDPFQDIYGLIRGADLVITITGTAGYEAALMGVPSLGLAPVFFSSLLVNDPETRSHPLEWRMRELLALKERPVANPSETERKSIEFLAHLHANSSPGNPIDVEAPAARRAAPDYLRVEAQAFSALLSGFRKARSTSRQPSAGRA